MTTSQTLVILGVVVLVVIAGIGFMITRPSAAPAVIFPGPTSTPSGTVTVPNDNVQNFTASHATGFEGVNYRVTSTLQYPSPAFSATQDPQNQTRIILQEGSKTHEIYIFSNDGAGFTGVDEAFNGLFKNRLCSTCVKQQTNPISPDTVGAYSVGTYANADTEVIVLNYRGFFVGAKLIKPSTNAEMVLSTFRLNYARTNELLPYQQ
jgi:hypothetical protein